MASHYTCRACSRAISRPSAIIIQAPQRTAICKAPISNRNLSTSTPRAYNATRVCPEKEKKLSARPNASTDSLADTPTISSLQGLAYKIRKKAPLMTETYVAYGATQELLKECAKHGDYKIPQALEKNGEIPTDETGAHLGVGSGWWYESLGLAPTFINWAQITFIHMYMLQVRFRMFPSTHAPIWIQHLTNHCFYAAEDRLAVWHKLSSNSLRQKYLKDIFSQWRAVLLSYDEGLVKGDAMLAAAVWRNLFGGREDVDFQKLAQVVAYMRRELQRLDAATDDEVAQGMWTFPGNPGSEADTVKRPSRLMQQNVKV